MSREMKAKTLPTTPNYIIPLWSKIWYVFAIGFFIKNIQTIVLYQWKNENTILWNPFTQTHDTILP